MGFRLTAIEIAAIGAAGLAVLVVLVFIIYTFRRRQSPTSRKRSLKSSPKRAREETPRGWGFGWTSSPSPSPPFSGYPPAGGSPSTGSRTPGGSPGSGQTKSPASGSTTLVTPTSSSSKLKRGAASPITGKKSPFRSKPKTKAKPKGKKTKGAKTVEPPRPSPASTVHRPESEEMVMVTYEQGLANMGMVRPHHIFRYSEPPPFDQARQAYPVHVPESGLSRELPHGNSEILTGSGGSRSGLGSASPDRPRMERDRRVEHQRTAGRRRGDDSQSTWLPSYYRSPESNRRQLDDEESDLGYRAGGGVDGRARYPGWI